MTLSFATVGNATLLLYDDGPVLVTDPWLGGSCYFGSWGLSHQVPADKAADAIAAPFVWISHGHPDHLHMESLRRFGKAQILVPDHVGGRVAASLREAGFSVEVLRSRRWRRLSPRISVMNVADYRQDAVLFCRIGDDLVLDVNDASTRGWGATARRLRGKFRHGYALSLLRLPGFMDPDMSNFFLPDGSRVDPTRPGQRDVPLAIENLLQRAGCSTFVPFSSHHYYRRADSAWANEYSVELSDYASRGEGVLPAFVEVDVASSGVTELDPPSAVEPPVSPETCGDVWSDDLTREDRAQMDLYFDRFKSLRRHYRFVRFTVGATSHDVYAERDVGRIGLEIHAPRRSLMTALQHRVFEDLLIANFCRITLHGDTTNLSTSNILHPHFTPKIARYGDNAGRYSAVAVAAYLARYMFRSPMDFASDELARRRQRSLSRTDGHT